MFRLGNKSRENLDGVQPVLVRVIERALQISKVDFGIPNTGGKRTAKEQWLMYLDGKSQLDGYVEVSNHQIGEAFDIFAYVDGKANYDICNLALCACAVLQAASELGVRIAWGGHFTNFLDMPHFELKR